MKIIIAKIAQREFNEAKEFYEIEQAGLGVRFEKEIKNAILRIKQYSSAWPIERGEVRHSNKIASSYLRSLINIEGRIIGLIE